MVFEDRPSPSIHKDPVGSIVNDFCTLEIPVNIVYYSYMARSTISVNPTIRSFDV